MCFACPSPYLDLTGIFSPFHRHLKLLICTLLDLKHCDQSSQLFLINKKEFLYSCSGCSSYISYLSLILIRKVRTINKPCNCCCNSVDRGKINCPRFDHCVSGDLPQGLTTVQCTPTIQHSFFLKLGQKVKVSSSLNLALSLFFM